MAMGDAGTARISVYNSLNTSIHAHMWRPEAWQGADIGGELAGKLGPTLAVMDPETVVVAINTIKLINGVAGTPQLLFGATIASQFTEIASGQTIDVYTEQLNAATTSFKPSFWAEMVGKNTLTLLITSPYGAVSFGAKRSDHDFSVTRYGVRHGTDPNGDGHFHRWGEGGHYTHINTGASPSIVALGGVYHLFFVEVDGPRIFHSTSSNGYDWSRVEPIGLDSSAAPCAVVYWGNQLHVFARDPRGNGTFDYCSTDGGSTFSNFGYIRQDGDDQRSAAEFRNKLCVVMRDHQGKAVMFSTYDSNAHGWQPGDTGMRTSASPGLISYRDRLHLFFRDGEGQAILHAYSEDGFNWPSADAHGLGPFNIGYNTSTGPRPVIHQGKLKIIFRDGSGNGILCVSSEDGFHFAPESPDWYLGMNCDENPSAANLGEHVCVVAKDAGGNGIMSIVPDLT